jgi:negative regulator of replication initiation
LVVTLDDADGSDIKHWGESAADIIDRTLYLSDNSS